MGVCTRAGRRHRIETSGVPRMAASEPGERKADAPQHAKAQHRLERVLRAARVEAARRPEQRAHRPLVKTDQEDGELAHCSLTFFQSAARLARSAGAAAVREAGRAPTTRSTEGSSRWCRRKDSRTMRRRRLRATALPATLTATAIPKRGVPTSFALAVTEKNASLMRRPRA